MKTFAEKNWGDCSTAIGYGLNFVQITYLQGSSEDYFENGCSVCSSFGKQSRNFVCKKSDLSKKDYYQLSFGGMGVSDALKKEMVDFGIGEEQFRPIISPRGDVLGYQIAPTRSFALDPDKNGMVLRNVCSFCGKKHYEIQEETFPLLVYDGLGYPLYTENEFYEHLAIDPLSQEILISTLLYNHLLTQYPRLECRPIFFGSQIDDPEYIRVSAAHRIMNEYKQQMLAIVEKGKAEDKEVANLRLALLNAVYPNNAPYEIVPSIQAFFFDSPSINAAIIGSYFKSLYGEASEDTYLPYLKQVRSSCSSMQKTAIGFLEKLHRESEEGSIDDWDTRLQQFEEDAYPNMTVATDPERFIEQVVCFQ